MNRIAKFYKVSFEQFLNDWIDTFPDFNFGSPECVKILENIEPDLRLTVTLYYYDELSIKEISKVLNIPEGTVKSRLARARGKLYDILKGGEESGQK